MDAPDNLENFFSHPLQIFPEGTTKYYHMNSTDLYYRPLYCTVGRDILFWARNMAQILIKKQLNT